MSGYEYKILPAPAKGRKGPGIKGAEARFAFGLETAINQMARQGWEYQRADLLPSSERQGLTSSQTVYRSVLVFRRPLAKAVANDPAEDEDSARMGAPEDDQNPESESETEDTPQEPAAASDDEDSEHNDGDTADDGPTPGRPA